MKKTLIIILSFFPLIIIQAQNEYRFIESSKDSIFYEVEGKGKIVLFLSGGPGGSPESLKSIVNYVSKNHRTILLHQRGTGLSSNRTDSTLITLNQYIDDINCIFEKENITNAYIIGHSWGAMLALDYMVKNPTKVEGLVLIGSPGYSLDFVKSMNNEIFKRMAPTEIDSLKTYFNQLNSSKDQSLINIIQNKVSNLTLSKQFYNPSLVSELLSSGVMNMKVNEMMMNDLKKGGWNLQQDLEQLDNPVIIINGNYDPIGKEYVLNLKHSLRNCELHFIDDCGHYIWIEKPKELQGIIEEFLRRN